MLTDALARKLIDCYQRGLPLVAEPFAAIADELGVHEEEVIETLKHLVANGALSRVGAVFNHQLLGASTLAAMEVPEFRIEEVANRVSAYREVNHNYLRENRLNLWFVVNAESPGALEATIDAIESESGLSVISFPMEQVYHIDLGFPLPWQTLNSLKEGAA